MRGKNIEDQLRAVNDTAARAFFHVAELHGREIVVHDHERHVAGSGLGADFFELAASDERRGIERIAHLQEAAGNFGAGALRPALPARRANRGWPPAASPTACARVFLTLRRRAALARGDQVIVRSSSRWALGRSVAFSRLAIHLGCYYTPVAHRTDVPQRSLRTSPDCAAEPDVVGCTGFRDSGRPCLQFCRFGRRARQRGCEACD